MVDVNVKVPALEKLLAILVSGVGAVGGPILARWKAGAMRVEAQGRADAQRIEAQGRADSMRSIAEAQRKAKDSLAIEGSSVQGRLSIDDEIKARLDFQEEKRQRNIVSVVGMAAKALGDAEVADREVDHDWTARFFADVQDVTSEDMQRIWAKILAGEVETPGRTSLSTLAILKNMTQKDAEMFESIFPFVFSGALVYEKRFDKIQGYPNYDNLLRLDGYGLIRAISSVEKIFSPPEQAHFAEGREAYRISGMGTLKILAFPLTPQGKELYGLTETDKNEEYLKEIAKFSKEKGDFKLERAPVLEKFPNNEFRPGSWTLVDPQLYDQTAPPIEEVIDEIMRDVPDEEWDKLPRDLSHRHDFYLYGRDDK